MLLEGKVVVVTGAGNGIGREHALACARAGARVLVNDLGGGRDGSGASSTAAESVVAEIVAEGGEAIANGASVTDPEACTRIVAAAVERWGRLDCVVNNAGILRDRSFAKMSDDEWGSVIDVHLHGSRNVIKAALPALTVHGGSIINTTSISGMIGNNFGQSNYAAAKAGIYGLTRVLAVELARARITVNAIAPIAKTRMTADLDRVDAAWGPERVAPLVVFLASDLARHVTGRVFGVAGGRIHAYEVHVSEGVATEGVWTAEEISEKLNDILAFPATR